MSNPERDFDLSPEEAERNIGFFFDFADKAAADDAPANDPAAEPPNPAEDLIAADLVKQEKEREKLYRYKQHTKHSDDLHALRQDYVPKLYWMICLWLLFVAVIIFLSGYSAENINNPDCQINCTRFKLTDQVLIAFITTTTATVVGLFVIVAKWLFPAPEKNK